MLSLPAGRHVPISHHLTLIKKSIGRSLFTAIHPEAIRPVRLGEESVDEGTLRDVFVFVLLWGGLVALIWFQFSGTFTTVEIIAIGAAGAVAVVSSALSYGFWRLGGRVTTVLLAYPFAMTAIFLPPVVAALYSTALADVVLSGTDSLAVWFVQEGPDLFGLTDYLVAEFDLEGVAYVLLWFAIAVPLGWLLGGVVTLADLVRPTPE